MKDLMQKVKSFITFDFPTDKDYLSTHFASTHHYHQKDIPEWSTNATRQKIIAVYWLTHVLQHFVFVIGSASLLTMLISSNFEFSFIGVVIIVGLIIFPIFLLFHYWPTYSYSFLPQLETVKEFYERKQSEQLEKCRQAQLSNPALVLIYYVFDKTSSLNSLGNSNQIASLLMKLYGVDQGSLKKNLELILGTSSKRKNLSDRQRTEMKNRFNEAYEFFEMLQFQQGVQILQDLEIRFV